MTTMQMSATHADHHVDSSRNIGQFMPFLVAMALVAATAFLSIVYVGLPH